MDKMTLAEMKARVAAIELAGAHWKQVGDGNFDAYISYEAPDYYPLCYAIKKLEEEVSNGNDSSRV